MNRSILRNVTFLITVSLVLASVTYAVDIWLFSSHPYISLADIVFIEGIIFIIVGAVLFLGSGGISRASQRAAMLAATASAMGKEVIGPTEIFRRDSWKPKGFIRLGLILIMTGVILLLVYFALT